MGNDLGSHCSCPCFGRKTKNQNEPVDMAGSSGSEGNGTSVNEKPADVMPPIPPIFPIENEDQLPPHYGPIKQLYANGYNLSIEADGTIKGTPELFSKWAVLKFSSAGMAEIRIMGIESQYYLAMNENGDLYGSTDGDSEETVFQEQYVNRYLYYRSKKYSDKNWYVGITKAGRPKNGKKTEIGQKATKFLYRPAYAS